ncbi:HD domain-containing protein [Salinarimonas rosea]|uniref:HD domain-containing protein n=1 Tax=Salinarimonas rosea TaxID=552063 RepID=UPI000694954C|nr:HD domain-containing protein [Salinarimonas rosea]
MDADPTDVDPTDTDPTDTGTMTATDRDLASVLDFLVLAERLKTELRHSWLSDGRRESVAEHTWMMALMALALGPRLEHPVDVARAMELVVVHDIAETEVGDIPVFEKSARKAAKARAEAAAMERICARLPPDLGARIGAAWREFEDGVTPEARFARALDHLEVQLQHNLADLDTWEPVELGLVWTKMDGPCAHDATLRALAAAIRARAEAKLAAAGHDVAALRAQHATPRVQP